MISGLEDTLNTHCSPVNTIYTTVISVCFVAYCRGGAGISKVVRPLHIKDDSCMADDIEQRQCFFRKQEGTGAGGESPH